MATLLGGGMAGLSPLYGGASGHLVSSTGSGISFGAAAAASITMYTMRGRDVDCGSLTYRTWTVSSVPDYTGASYVGTRCGATAFADVVITRTRQA